MFLECYAYTHNGKKRKNNQDRLYFNGDIIDSQIAVKKLTVDSAVASFAVFDGMGGGRFGDVAAEIAAECMSKAINSGEGDLKAILLYINNEICRYMSIHEIYDMGTTAAVIAFDENRANICNIGDSRIYRVFNGEIEQMSIDHTMQSNRFKCRRVLTQYLGVPKEEILIEPYTESVFFNSGEKYLICSDGLTDMVSDQKIKDIVLKNSLSTAGEKLLNAALESGGNDNISIVICKITK